MVTAAVDDQVVRDPFDDSAFDDSVVGISAVGGVCECHKKVIQPKQQPTVTSALLERDEKVEESSMKSLPSGSAVTGFSSTKGSLMGNTRRFLNLFFFLLVTASIVLE